MEHSEFETDAIRVQNERSHFREHSSPIYMTSSFVFDSAEDARARFNNEIEGPIYSRFSNPNCDELIAKLTTLEGAEDGLATASGMAAVFTSFAGLLKSGDHIVSSRQIFGSTHQIISTILTKWNIEYTYVDACDLSGWEKAVQSNTRMLYVETPTNPGLMIADLQGLSQLAKSKGLILAVDNCFATPYLQKPLSLGADIVIHSATKFIDGQGRSVGGAILGKKQFMEDMRFFARQTGPALSPFNAWLLSKSIETLAVRMDRQCDNALELATFLEKRQGVRMVVYPGLVSHPSYEIASRQMKKGGALVAFELEGGLDNGRRFLDALKLLSLTANLGDSRTIATHPASTTHSKLTEKERLAAGITPGFIRISTGLEHINDIIADIDQAIQKACEKK